jgi:RNA:NAD 2'-phosphotransferase (TPT1/KptA family)
MSKKVLYHATKTVNVKPILEKGLLAIWEGVYLTDSIESAQRWMGFRFAAQGDRDFAVIEVEVDEDQLTEGMDHNPLMVQLSGVGKSIVHVENIPPKQIRDVHYYQLAE